MHVKTAKRGDLAKVFREIAERMRAEYEIAGFELRAAKSIFTECVDAGQAHAIFENGQPVAIIAWRIEGDVIYTSFAAKENFFSGRTVRFCFQHIRNIQKDNGDLPVCSSSFSPHPAVPKWFRVLGFSPGQSSEKHTEYWLHPS